MAVFQTLCSFCVEQSNLKLPSSSIQTVQKGCVFGHVIVQLIKLVRNKSMLWPFFPTSSAPSFSKKWGLPQATSLFQRMCFNVKAHCSKQKSSAKNLPRASKAAQLWIHSLVCKAVSDFKGVVVSPYLNERPVWPYDADDHHHRDADHGGKGKNPSQADCPLRVCVDLVVGQWFVLGQRKDKAPLWERNEN